MKFSKTQYYRFRITNKPDIAGWKAKLSTVCKVFAPFFPICITCYTPMRTINFGKYLRLFQIKPIKTVEFRFMQIGKKGAKILHTVYQR